MNRWSACAFEANPALYAIGGVSNDTMMVNTQNLMYREDILSDLGIAVPTTRDEVYAAAETIKAAGVLEYPMGATMKSGWNLAMKFINMYPGFDGKFFNDDNTTAVNSETGVKALETKKAASPPQKKRAF